MLRATGVFVVSVVAVAALDGALRGRTDAGALHAWASTATTVVTRPWRLVTSIPLTSGRRMTVGMCAVIALLFGAAEWRLGWRPAAIAGVAGSIVATLACDAVLLAASAAGVSGATAAAAAPDFGPSAVTAAAAGGVAATVPVWVAVALAALTLNGVVVHHSLPDWEHLVAFTVGFALLRRWGR